MVLGVQFPQWPHPQHCSVSTAAALCVARNWPRAGTLAMVLAVLWTSLIAVSRLVLGVHWPSDVLAAVCLGAFIPLLISVANDLRRRNAGGAGTSRPG